MKPRTRQQQEIAELSKRLPKLSKAQRAYAFEHCFKHYAHRTKKGIITCLECGHQWKSQHHLAESGCGCTCPHCGKELNVADTKKRVFKEVVYYSVITTCKQYQVIRHFYAKITCKVGKQAEYSITEVVQRWIAPNGKYETIARLRNVSFYYYDNWNLNTSMEIRRDNGYHVYDISPYCIYPRMCVIPEIRRNGFKGDFHKIRPFDFFTAILKNSKQETLLKAGQYDMLSYSINSHFKIENYWSSIKICIRNGYEIIDASMWRDYIDLLRYFGKDTNNSIYVCPVNLKTKHDRFLEKKLIREEYLRLQKQRTELKNKEEEYRKEKERFFAISFGNENIIITVIQSVAEMLEEGNAMHHCVYAGGYYTMKNSLILSAKDRDGNRIETIEVSLKTFRVVQSRGICNQNTEKHDEIIRLVENNMNLIKEVA